MMKCPMLSIGSKIRLTITYGVCIRRMLAGRRSVINEATYQHLSKVSKEDTTLYSLLFKKKKGRRIKNLLKKHHFKKFHSIWVYAKTKFCSLWVYAKNQISLCFGVLDKQISLHLGVPTTEFHSSLSSLMLAQ